MPRVDHVIDPEKCHCSYCTVIADEPERPWSSRAINSYRPADAFHEITSCGGALPIKVLPANLCRPPCKAHRGDRRLQNHARGERVIQRRPEKTPGATRL